jgi:uncharacterized protein (TIGR04255 family)
MTVQLGNPFDDAPVEDIVLPEAPLVRTIAQVRFPAVAAIAQQDYIIPFQEALRERYPVLRPEREVGVTLTPDGVSSTSAGVVWRFQDVAGAWRVSLAPTFVAVETGAYRHRRDYLERYAEVLNVLSGVIQPAVFDRVGLRYVNRFVPSGSLSQLVELIRPELLGILSVELPEHVNLAFGLTDTLFAFDNAQLHARWGYLPAGATVDPGIEASDQPSFLLDLDMFQTGEAPFSVDTITDATENFGIQAYRFFRWAVTEDALRRAGAVL